MIPQDAVGDRDIPGHDGHEVVKVRYATNESLICVELAVLTGRQVVLAELADAFATVVSSKDIN